MNILNNLSCFVPGVPKPQGSKSVSRSGHLYDSNARELKPWRLAIAKAIRARYPKLVIDEAVRLTVVFYFERPASHFNKSGLKGSSPKAMQTKPDLDKLIRAVGDGLSVDAGLLKDDSRISSIKAEKRYCERQEVPGALILLSSL